ncbi:MAG: ribosome maturation factor RimM [Deltaproteobacteria bacterium]|nr:ribosome maturation factor RimM [Deltaproteobacteria bacterium]
MSSKPPNPEALIGLGQVSGAQGLLGAVKVRADAEAATTDPEVFAALGEVWIGGRGYRVLKAGRHKNQVLLWLEGVDTRSRAEELAGLKVLGDRRRFPRLPPGEFYWFQVLGLSVVNEADGALLGYLDYIIPTPGHDVYVVRRGEREVLLPAVEEVIVDINLEAGVIKVLPPLGLLEIDAD